MRLIPSNNIYSFSFISNSKHIMEVITFLFFTILCLAPSARCSDPLQSTSKNLQEQQNFRTEDYSAEQKNRKEDDQIQKLPGQSSVNFIQYSGYVAVGSKDEKALFYYFTQSEDPTNKPLVLWLTGEIDEADVYAGKFDYMWTHALISDETHEGIIRNCKFSNLSDVSDDCINYINKAYDESGNINPYNIYVPSSCDLSLHATPNDLNNYNPCSMKYVTTYLNKVEVQKALHVNVINGKPMKWTPCNTNIPDNWTDSPNSVLPIIKNLMANGIRVLINSPSSFCFFNSSRYFFFQQVGGYAVGYNKNMVFATLRGAGHGGAVDQPKNALTLIASFLAGKLPPSCGK
ncbi:serine carboxypeptidase-like protein [Striga asiatica]|uniref:Serine carboxypeptidase-like protein n=1 Tax=Striga asiatica TaxID=4170 RepID=A0A5A7QE14_STRAF|nr:serine carboxypeptidase-like protein [Striga asiatica]